MTKSTSLSSCRPTKRSTKTLPSIPSKSTMNASISQSWFRTKWECISLTSKEKQSPHVQSSAKAPSFALIHSPKPVNSSASLIKADILSLRKTTSEYGSDSNLQNWTEIVPLSHTERNWNMEQLLLLLEITQNPSRRNSKRRSTSFKWDTSMEQKPLQLEARPRSFCTAG